MGEIIDFPDRPDKAEDHLQPDESGEVVGEDAMLGRLLVENYLPPTDEPTPQELEDLRTRLKFRIRSEPDPAQDEPDEPTPLRSV